MLEYLHVKNLALIRECELEFSEGLNILTGETGAGKSVLLGSVNLALGAKADKDMIRQGETEASVELCFSKSKEAGEALREMEISDEDDTVLISRKITETKSVFKINGEIATAKQVKELAGSLIDIHGQHEHQSLLKNSRQLKMLDAYGGEALEAALLKTAECAHRLNELKTELDEAVERSEGREREISLLEYECKEIEAAKLVPGEDDELEENYRRMQSSEKLLNYTGEALNLVSGDSGEDAGALISRAVQAMRRVESMDASSSEILSKLEEAEELIGDFSLDISKYMDSLEFSPEEFAKTEERLNLINSLKVKFGATIEKILDYYEEKSSELEKLNHLDEYLEELKEKTGKAAMEYKAAAADLSKLRHSAAESFSKDLTAELLSLSFLEADFSADIMTDEAVVSENGFDKVEFMISTNPGEPRRPMRNVASGGELSRIMLAIKTILAAKDSIDSLIFDEIDAGISGRTAWEVSKKLSGLSKAHQVIAITHLAQIAAMADTHFEIEKSVSDGRTVTNITKLDADGEIRELARLLGTDSADEKTKENARELKAKANAEKQ